MATGRAVFEMPSGVPIEAPLPDITVGYVILPVRGRLLVVREGADGRPRPENLSGVAVLYVRDGKVREAFVGREAPEAPKP